MTTVVFVYGTLRAGQPNHHFLVGARALGLARTAAGFRLVDLGHFPAMMRDVAGSVVGELYEVDPLQLAALDRFEGHPSFYRRQRVDLANSGIAEAYVMEKSLPGWTGLVINSGDWCKR